jgi:hypothetical protein
MSFFVFHSMMEYFRDNFKVGVVAGIPLDKFDDGDTRFLDEKNIEKGAIVPPEAIETPDLSESDKPMPRLVYKDESVEVFFEVGDFDAYKVSVESKELKKKPTLDEEWLSLFAAIAQGCDNERAWDDFVRLLCATKPIDKKSEDSEEAQMAEGFKECIAVASPYKNATSISHKMMFLYACMVAEEMKDKTQYGKYIKAAGLYSLLEDDLTPKQAADFMKGSSVKGPKAQEFMDKVRQKVGEVMERLQAKKEE